MLRRRMQRSASVVKMIIRQVALKREVEPAKKAAPKLRAVEAAAKMAMEEAGSEWDGDFSEEEQEEGEPVTVKAAPKR